MDCYHAWQIDDMFGVVAESSTAALRAAGSIPTRTKYLYGLQIVISGSGCLCMWIVCV